MHVLVNPVIDQQEKFSTFSKGLLNAILVYFLLFTSGSRVFEQSANNNIILIFVISTLMWALFSDRKINDKFILYVCVFTGFLLLIHLYTGKSLTFISVVGTTIKLLIAYLILKTVGKDIVETYVKVIIFLAVISLFGFLTDSLSLFDGLIHKLPKVGNTSYEGIFYIFRYRVHIDRNNSIFFEPGAYQIFLNTALFMLFFAKTTFSTRKKWVFISILTITLATTFSTTGYLTFGAIFCLLVLKSDMVSRHGKVVLVGLLMASLLVFTAQFRSVIIEKIETFLAIQDITDSSDRRSFDALVDMEIFKNNILGVGHKKYFEEFNVIGQIKEGSASSNGLTRTLATYGLPFSLFFFGSYYWFFKKYFRGVLMRVVPYGLLLIFLFSESYYVFTPFCLALISAIFIYEPMIKERKVSNDNDGSI